MSSVDRRYSREEFAQRGDAIYAARVEPTLRPTDFDKFATIDIDSEDFAIDADELAACDRLRQSRPAAQIWIVRVGSRFVHRFGAGHGAK